MADETPAQQKARLRRERRNQKIQGGGASRLQAITALQGGHHASPEEYPARPSPSPSPQPPPTSSTPDPAEIDISQHHYTPAAQPRPVPLQPNSFAYNGTSTPPFPNPNAADPSQDPMMAMLQQIMAGGGAGGIPGASGAPGAPGAPGAVPGQDMPPNLANMFQAMSGGAPAQQESSQQSSAYVWRIIHAMFSLSLSLYIIMTTPFTGSLLSRTTSITSDESWHLDSTPPETLQKFFYAFATFEVLAQSSRYFIERGHLSGGGFLHTVSAMLPDPYAGYVRIVGRYSTIWSTVVSDAMVVIFVLGAASWWQGGQAA